MLPPSDVHFEVLFYYSVLWHGHWLMLQQCLEKP